MYDSECLFCEIVKGEEESKVILDLEDFLIIENKYPKAPVHVLVLDKKHREKKDTIGGEYANENYWDAMFSAINEAISHLGLDKSGYKLVNNGAGYNHFEHEHVHILGGSDEEPGGET